MLNSGKIIYLDNNSTTRMDDRVLEAMMPFFKDEYANAASYHRFAIIADEAVKQARNSVANLIGSEDKEIIFTSGATEAINLAIKGVAESYIDKGRHIIVSTSEHRAVLETCKYLESIGFEVTYIATKPNGIVDIDELKKTIRYDTTLVCIMLVNNETGVIQPIKEIAKIAHAYGTLLFTDATQAVGKIGVDVNDLGIDLMSFSAHKFYGPKGIGGLFIRKTPPHWVKIRPLFHGGGHEMGLRSGTLNVPGIVGFGKAAEIALTEMTTIEKRVGQLRDLLENGLLQIKDTSVNGSTHDRLYNVSNICFKNIYMAPVVGRIREITVATGSACSSASMEPSHVLKSMGLTEEEAYSSVRFSLGRYNTIDEINEVIREFDNIVGQYRLSKAMSR